MNGNCKSVNVVIDPLGTDAMRPWSARRTIFGCGNGRIHTIYHSDLQFQTVVPQDALKFRQKSSTQILLKPIQNRRSFEILEQESEAWILSQGMPVPGVNVFCFNGASSTTNSSRYPGSVFCSWLPCKKFKRPCLLQLLHTLQFCSQTLLTMPYDRSSTFLTRDSLH